MLIFMVRRRTASNVTTGRSRPGVSQHPVPGPQANWNGPVVGEGEEPTAYGDADGGARRPQREDCMASTPDKTVHRLQHTYRTGRILPRHSKNGVIIFFARLTRGFFEFSEFSRCQKPVVLAIRVALFAWAKADFAGTAVRKGFVILRVVEKALFILFARLFRVGRK